MLFITHALPRNLQVDEVVRIGGERLSVVAGDRPGKSELHEYQAAQP